MKELAATGVQCGHFRFRYCEAQLTLRRHCPMGQPPNDSISHRPGLLERGEKGRCSHQNHISPFAPIVAHARRCRVIHTQCEESYIEPISLHRMELRVGCFSISMYNAFSYRTRCDVCLFSSPPLGSSSAPNPPGSFQLRVGRSTY